MSKLTKQNVGGVNYTMVGCTLTGVCPSAAADFVKAVTLSDGDVLSDGMMVACTFANGNSAGEAPGTLTIYSSDQVNYYSDAELTQPFTLAPSGCYTIEYTGTGNAYTYSSFPVIQVGDVSGPLCASNGTPSGGTAWSTGDTVLLLYTGGKFLAISIATNTVASGNMHSVTSNAVNSAISALKTISRWSFLSGSQSVGVLPVVSDAYNDNPNIYLDGNKLKFRGSARYLVIVHITGQIENADRLFFKVEGLNMNVHGISYGAFAECDIVFPTEVNANTEIYIDMVEPFKINGGGLAESYIAFSQI